MDSVSNVVTAFGLCIKVKQLSHLKPVQINSVIPNVIRLFLTEINVN